MSTDKQYTEEQQKELISRAQLDECLVRYGWLPNPITRDLGEDIIVQIYDERRWSGLSFYIQLKGTDDISKYALKTRDCVSYDIEVDKILRWDGASLPVIFMVWDIEQRIGVWSLINQVIRTLIHGIHDGANARM